ncbi:MAG: hypothetical protein VX278_06300 [Myxococcota bacterium]|nr:hypothetical protein [Myxococcota bacterium]
MLLLMSQLVLAQDWLLSVSEPYEIRSGGTFARPFATPQGWKIFLGAGNMRVADLQPGPEGWLAENIRPIVSMPEIHFNDHGVQRCPDGTYLHIASTDTNQPNDTAYIWRYNEDMSVLSSSILVKGSSDYQYNDPSIICSSFAEGVAGSNRGQPPENQFYFINNLSERSETVALASYPRVNGGGIFVDEQEEKIFVMGMAHGNPFHVNVYDTDWVFQEEHEIDLLDAPMRAYWPQNGLRIGDYYTVVFMGRDDTWPGDDQGDVFLGIFDLNWSLQDVYPMTTYEASAAMRPWIACDRNTLLVAYDSFLEHMVVEVKLNEEAFGLYDGNMGDCLPTTKSISRDTENPGSTTVEVDGGCNHTDGSGPWWLALLGIPLAFRRHRQSRST